MKKILIYGDSNLWGFNAYLNERIPDKYQWSNLLSEYLGSDYKIIQEGLPGRIAGKFELVDRFKNGMDTFEAIFKSCSPVDYVVIALGSNDLLKEYNRKAIDIYNDLMWYKEKVIDIYSIDKYKKRYFNNNSLPDFIYILPGNFDYLNDAKNIFDCDSEEERIKLIELFKNSKDIDYVLLNNIDLIKNDGLHYSELGHKMVFNKVKTKFRK